MSWLRLRFESELNGSSKQIVTVGMKVGVTDLAIDVNILKLDKSQD